MFLGKIGLDQKLENSCCIILDKIGQEIMFDDHLVRKRAPMTKLILSQGNIGIFLKGLTHDFGQKLGSTPWFVFGQNTSKNNV